jgi:hypothetical protein
LKPVAITGKVHQARHYFTSSDNVVIPEQICDKSKPTQYKQITASWFKSLKLVVLNNTIFLWKDGSTNQSSASETIQGSSLSFQSIHHIHGRHGLASGMLSVRHSITDHILQKDLQHTSSFLVNQPADTLHSASPGQTPDSRLRDTLDVIAQDLPVTLGATLAQTLASLSTPRHGSRTDETARRYKNSNKWCS